MLLFKKIDDVSPPRRTFSLCFKCEVVKKAFPSSGAKVSIRSIAREYKVQTNQIQNN